MNTKNQDNSNRDTGLHIGLDFGGLFKGLENIVKQVSDMVEKGEQFRKQEQTFRGKGSLKDLHGVYGFSIKMGLGGEPVVESFGNVKNTDKGPVVEETREPITDIIDEGREIQVTAEMPGISQDDIRVQVDEDVCTLEAESPQKKYQKELLLPAPVHPKLRSVSLQNGILELRFQKK